MDDVITQQLRETCKLTNSNWAVWSMRVGGLWVLKHHNGLEKNKLVALQSLLSDLKVMSYMEDGLVSGRTRSYILGEWEAILGCSRIFIYPNPKFDAVLIVGANQLDNASRDFFRVLNKGWAPQFRSETSNDLMIANIQVEASMDQVKTTYDFEMFDLLTDLSSAVSMEADESKVVAMIIEGIKRTFNTDLVSVLLLSSDRKNLYDVGESYPSPSTIKISVNESLSGYVAERGVPIRVGDITKAPRYLKLITDVNSALAVPLKFRGKVIGVLELISRTPDAYSLKDEQLLILIANQLAGLIENIHQSDESSKHARNLELINQVVQAIVEMTNVTQIAQTAAEMLTRRFGYEIVLVSLKNKDSEYHVVKGGSLVSSDIEHGHKFPIEAEIVGQVYRDGNSRLIDDVSLESELLYFPGLQSGSVICVALRDGSSVFGVITVIGSRRYDLTENDLLVLEALAGVLSSFMIHARDYEQLQMRLRHLQAVRDTAIDISADLELNTLLERVTIRAQELVGAKGAELGLVNDRNQTVEIKVSKNPWEGYSKRLILPFNQGVAGHMAVEGNTLIVNNYNSWNGRLKLDKPAPFEAVAGVPLVYGGKVIGTLTISHDEPLIGFNPEDIRLLELLAPQVAVAVRNARLYQELQSLMEAEREAKDHLVRSARLAAVGELAAGVAHELNNPLTTIIGFAELVLDELPKDNTIRQDIELVLKESRRARDVVKRLLDFSRPSDGFRVFTNINDLIYEIVALIRHLTYSSGIELKLEIIDDLPLILVDPDQIKQVLLNLLQNAIQALPTGGVINIQTTPEIRNQSKGVMVRVKDSGHGIAPEIIDRIFEPFFTTRPTGKGTGLGLSVSYGIVSDHGGIIEVESKPNEGSIFSVWLPIMSNKVQLFIPGNELSK